MPRPPTPYETARIHLVLPAEEIATLDKLIAHPTSGKPTYGARSEVVRILLSSYIRAYRLGKREIDVTAVHRYISTFRFTTEE